MSSGDARRRAFRAVRLSILLALVLAAGCAKVDASPPDAANTANAGLDSLNARLAAAYRTRDPAAYAALYTDSAVFEWPGLAPIRGPAALGDMVREMWSAERDVDLQLKVAARRATDTHATEFGAFEQTWRDSAGVVRTEYGRYASLLVRDADGAWHLDRFLGFEDSTAVVSR